MSLIDKWLQTAPNQAKKPINSNLKQRTHKVNHTNLFVELFCIFSNFTDIHSQINSYILLI